MVVLVARAGPPPDPESEVPEQAATSSVTTLAPTAHQRTCLRK